MTIRADFAIIGAGPGGYVAALWAAQQGAEVVCIEKRRSGGVCLNEGCIPTKALVRTAEIYALAQQATKFGVQTGEVGLDWAKAQGRMRAVVEQEVRGVEMLLSRAGVRTMIGSGAFLRPDIVSVQMEDGQETVQAEHVLIATGSRTAQIPIPGLDGPGVIDHWGALNLEALPASVCIIGAGAIGLEFASIFCEMGVEVTLRAADGELRTYSILGDWDSDEAMGILPCRSRLARALEGHGVGDRVTIPGVAGDETVSVEAIRPLSAAVLAWAGAPDGGAGNRGAD